MSSSGAGALERSGAPGCLQHLQARYASAWLSLGARRSQGLLKELRLVPQPAARSPLFLLVPRRLVYYRSTRNGTHSVLLRIKKYPKGHLFRKPALRPNFKASALKPQNLFSEANN